MSKAEPEKEPTIRDLYPHFTEKQLKEAEENLRQYAELAIRIVERLQRNPVAYAEFRRRVARTKRKRKRDNRAESGK